MLQDGKQIKGEYLKLQSYIERQTDTKNVESKDELDGERDRLEEQRSDLIQRAKANLDKGDLELLAKSRMNLKQLIVLDLDSTKL